MLRHHQALLYSLLHRCDRPHAHRHTYTHTSSVASKLLTKSSTDVQKPLSCSCDFDLLQAYQLVVTASEIFPLALKYAFEGAGK